MSETLLPDNSGELNIDELDDAFRKMGIDLTQSELKDLVEEVDVDGNGLIDKDEFCMMVLTTVSLARLRSVPRDRCHSFLQFNPGFLALSRTCRSACRSAE